MLDGIVRNCCPICGAPITASSLCQYSLDYKILKSGRMSKRYRKTDCGTMEVWLACCSGDCGASWEQDDFGWDDRDRFVDMKYTDEQKGISAGKYDY